MPDLVSGKKLKNKVFNPFFLEKKRDLIDCLGSKNKIEELELCKGY